MVLIKKIFLVTAFFLYLSEYCHSQSVSINEVMASNSNTLYDEDGDYEDWIELYNHGQQAVSLNGFGFTDNADNPFKWVFPSISIQPGQYLLIWASGKDRKVPGSALHTNFNISASGEQILLVDPSGNIIDELVPTSIPTDYSFGRYPNGTGNWRFFTSSTPGSQNIGPGYSFVLAPPVFSHPDGMYSSPFNLEISSPNTDAKIYFTLDGSEPTESSTLYTSPINISSRIGDPNDISMIPTNSISNPGPPYYEGWQPPLGEVFKINVVRAKVFHPDAPDGNVYTHSYIVDNKGSARFSLPYFSLATHRSNFFDNEIGIYVPGYYNNIFQDGDEWERPANISFFKAGGVLGFKEDIGVRLHGNTTRSRPRKSLRIASRAEYGSSWINYQLFSTKQVNRYKRFILRNSGNDWDWAIFRDAFIQFLAKDLKVETQHYFPSLLFINGEYWGIHNVRDRYDEHYIKSHYDIDEDEMTILQNNSEFKFGNPAGVDHYNSTRSYISSNSLSSDAAYQNVKKMMDVESFIDFQLIHIYSQNTDWPGNNTMYWRYLRDGYDENAPNGKDGLWRWMILDTDFGFLLPFFYVPGLNDGPAHNTLSFATEANGSSWPNPPWSTFLLRNLLLNQKFKYQFINRYCDLLNTTFSSEYVNFVIDSISSVLQPEMQEHINRWRRPTSLTEWRSNVDVMRNFASERPKFQRQHLRQKFGLSGEAYVTLNVSNELFGKVRINSIDIDESTMGVWQHPYPWTGYYFRGVPIEFEAIPLPGYFFSHWEGASSSTSPKITITPNSDIELTAHFIRIDAPQLIHFWFFGTNIPNDKPIESIEATFGIPAIESINYHSSLSGYPFYNGNPNWRKASLERRNNPTSINYRDFGNSGIPYEQSDIRGVQVKQPFQGDGGENSLVINASTIGFDEIFLRFAAINEGAASGLTIDYSTASGDPQWTTQGMSTFNFALIESYSLFEVDFSGIDGVSNNPNFKARIRFTGSNMTADEGNRVSFNNFSIDGKSMNAFTIAATSGENGIIVPYGNIGVYDGDSKSFTIIPDGGKRIVDVLVDGNSVLDDVSINPQGVGVYTFSDVSQSHSIYATFSTSTGVNTISDRVKINIYPNPASNYLNIKATCRINRIELFNALGSMVYLNKVDSREHSINVSSLKQGLYIARIHTEMGIAVRKVVVE